MHKDLEQKVLMKDETEVTNSLPVARFQTIDGFGCPSAWQWREIDCPADTLMSRGSNVHFGGTEILSK
jgi:hypothetical protein